MKMRFLLIVIIMSLMYTAFADIPLHDFKDLSIWRYNPDGGIHVQISRDTPSGGIRIEYHDDSPHWGNIQAPCTVPPNAIALRFHLHKISSDNSASLHIWLFEPDGDAWLQQVKVNGESLGSLKPGDYNVDMPVSGFEFQPRGPGSKQMTSANKMLIGCNSGNMVISLSGMFWETSAGYSDNTLQKSSELKIETGKRGNIGILDMGNLPDDFHTAHPSDELARVLRKNGFGVTLLNAGDFADPEILTRSHFDVVILPYGPFFPAQARKTFLAYLKAHGNFLSTDGYAFDRLLTWNNSRWSEASGKTAEEMDSNLPVSGPMNTRTGTPGDAMSFTDDQIGAFDPLDHIQADTPVLFHLCSLMNSLMYPTKLDGKETVEGFSACCLTGQNNPVFPPVYRRWIPLVQLTNERGRLCGTALALIRNYAGPFAGSSWAISGFTNGADLFLKTEARQKLLCKTVDMLRRNVYLHNLTTDLATYHKGEQAILSCSVTNDSTNSVSASIILYPPGMKPVKRTFQLSAGETKLESLHVLVKSKAPYQRFSAELYTDGEKSDELTGALCVWNPAILKSSAQLKWKSNYFEINGKPRFLIGTNQTGMMFYSSDENPQTWEEDFSRMEKAGLKLLRILHFSPFAQDVSHGMPSNDPMALKNRPKVLRRKLDAIVQLAQMHGVAIILTLHDWQGFDLSNEELAAQKKWDSFWADRYKNISGVLFDYQNEPNYDMKDTPLVRSLWNEWLKSKYGNDDAIRKAWRLQPPDSIMPDIPLGNMTNDWFDVRTADLWQFKAVVFNRWARANQEGVKQGNLKAKALIGFLQSMGSADKILGTKYVDIANAHYYGAVEDYPLEMKLIDRRFEGKGFSLGEFGAQDSHEARVQGNFHFRKEADIRRFQTVVHYAATLGGAFCCNWDLKEFDEMVFPWGLFQREDGLPKPWEITYSQLGKFLQPFQPVYKSPRVFLLVPDSVRLGGRFDDLYRGILRSISFLLDCRVNFGVINEQSLKNLPGNVQAVVWPFPYCPSDKTFLDVLAWVKTGGTLYISGDVAFDQSRMPTREQRRTDLGLLYTESPVSPFDFASQPWGHAPIESTCGKGKVFFTPYPIELKAGENGAGVYKQFLRFAGVSPITILPSDAPVRVASIPLKDGGSLFSLFRLDGGEQPLMVQLPEAHVSIQLKAYGTAFIAVDGHGRLVGAESEGELKEGNSLIADAKGHFGIVSLDGKDLKTSKKILVLPHQENELTVHGHLIKPDMGQTLIVK
jgi:hypothetical protein